MSAILQDIRIRLLWRIEVFSNLQSFWFRSTFLSPAAVFEPGERTGKFRVGSKQLLLNEQGESYISAEDYAIALLGEVENPQHLHQQMTIVQYVK
ncbi:hypothetical protein JOY44_25855 (plasmid) [Phormidium sp. CLA17]|nr:hypothetical protein [Leptolyngbya sp. Cla-17]